MPNYKAKSILIELKVGFPSSKVIQQHVYFRSSIKSKTPKLTYLLTFFDMRKENLSKKEFFLNKAFNLKYLCKPQELNKNKRRILFSNKFMQNDLFLVPTIRKRKGPSRVGCISNSRIVLLKLYKNDSIQSKKISVLFTYRIGDRKRGNF